MALKTIISDPDSLKGAKIVDEGALETINSGVPVYGERQKQIAYRDFFKDSAGSEDMTVDGSTQSIDFIIPAHTQACDRYVASISFEILGTNASLSQFGNISALTNGVDLIYSNPEAEGGLVNISLTGLKTNWEIVRLCKGEPSFGNSTNAFRASNVVGNNDAFIPFLDFRTVFGFAFGVRLRAGTDDRIILRINDDLTGVTGFTAVASGFDRLSVG